MLDLTLPFYHNAIEFAKIMIRKHVHTATQINAMDIVHTVITLRTVTIDNWKSLIITAIKSSSSSNIVSIQNLETKDLHSDRRCCKKCGEEYNSDMFKVGVVQATGQINYRAVCKLCYVKVRSKKPLTEEQREKNIIKNRLRREYLKKAFGRVPDATAKERQERYRNKQKALKQSKLPTQTALNF